MSAREGCSLEAVAADLLRNASYAVALTGAGVSTPSGIPDFRSPESGLWEHADSMEVASITGFLENPEAFYEWIRPLAAILLQAEPNPAHTALADLESCGCLKAVITQNIDGLHQRAGSREVLELHGHVRELICLQCRRVVGTADVLWAFVESGEPPRCAACGRAMKPTAVLFGEQLPWAVMASAREHVRNADLMLVAGSSLSVSPVSELPLLVRSQGGQLVIVNLMPTYADGFAECVIHDDASEVLPRIAQAVAEGIGD